uniref:Integrase catalytic domain-containing protein n=1 Tax=Hemiselmis andersenii TaxID=464988 RepID=A0A7S0TZN6_HEMAN|mmetsp:Transcript_32098/g.74670  ORF Transcript_32098/g.74670 Transcript_32098/m.74670 type:complete len:1038 (+) Transcript_32098:547-3660(+)
MSGFDLKDTEEKDLAHCARAAMLHAYATELPLLQATLDAHEDLTLLALLTDVQRPSLQRSQTAQLRAGAAPPQQFPPLPNGALGGGLQPPTSYLGAAHHAQQAEVIAALHAELADLRAKGPGRGAPRPKPPGHMNKRLGFLPPNGQSPASSGTAKTPAPFGAAKTLCAPGAAPAQAAGAPDATAARPALSPSEECGLTYASGSGGTLVKRCTNCTQPVSDCHHDASSCPHDFQWNNASQRSCIHAMALQGYTLVERDVKNHVIKFDRPCLFLPPSAPAALASCTSPSLPAVFDSGCGPVHCKQGPLTRPVVSFKLNGVAGSHPFTATPSSSAFLDTRTATGAPFRLLLPGTTYTSPAFPRTLISAGTLHRHGFSSHLRADGGTLVTPSGVHLPLSLHEGIYTFPSAAGDDRSSPCAFPAQVPTRTTPPSVVQRPPSPSGSTQRASSPLSPPPDDDVSPPPPPPTTTWSPAMLRQLDKVAVLHASNGHPGRSRLTRIVKAMAPDITRPSLQAVSLWYKHFPCEACIKAKARRPPSTLAHPPRAADPAGPGAKLSLDGAGHYKPTRRHNTDTIFATDQFSRARFAFPVPSISDSTILDVLNTWVAHSPTPLRHLHVDLQFHTKAVRAWCTAWNIALTFAAPDVHPQNGIAEKTVDLVKSTTRTNLLHAGLSNIFLDDAHEYACVQLNNTPMDKSGIAPLSLWPSAPFMHSTLSRFPFGCRIYGHTGKDPHAPNTGTRADVGIFLGHEPNSCSYRIYHSDAMTVKLSDDCLANYLVGKQLEVTLPQSWYPSYTHTWRARAQRLTRSGNAYAVEFVVAHYNGDVSTLSPSDQRAISTHPHHIPQILTIPVLDGLSTRPSGWITTSSVRSLLHAAYPTASTLADFAYESLLTWTPVTLADVPLVVRGDQQWPPPARSSTYAPTPSATDSSLGSKAPLKPTLPATSTLQLHFRCDSPVAFPSFLLGLPRAPSALPPAAPRRPAYERGGVSRTTQLASHASHPPRPHQWAPRPHHHAFPWDRVPSSHRVPGRSRVPSHGVHSVQ